MEQTITAAKSRKTNTIRVTPKPFTSINEGISQISLELLADGDEVTLINAEGVLVKTLELIDYTIVFEPDFRNVVSLPSRKLKLDKMIAEFLWYMTGNPSVEPIVPYLKNWARFANNEGEVNSNYGVRWKAYVHYVVNELVNDKFSRRACMNMFNVENYETFGKDTNCTMFWQFMIRNNKLIMFARFRSNDLLFGFSIDVFLNSLLHQMVYNELKAFYPELEMGEYHHNAASMHVYEDTCDKERLAKMWNDFHEMREIERYGKRFEINNDITLDNFWDKDQFKIDFPEMFEHFNKYRK